MRRTRLALSPPVEAASVRPLDPTQRHYLRDVLRLDDGAGLTVFDGQGGEWEATLSRVNGQSVLMIGNRLSTYPRESPLHLTLVQALTHIQTIDDVVARATELGVTCIVPVLASRGRIHLDRDAVERRRRRWQTIATSAAQQCGRSCIPECRSPQSLFAYLETLEAPSGDEWRLLLSPQAVETLAPSGDGPARPPRNLTVMVGPEGGWTEDEIDAARRHDFVPRRLGPRILRTGTAGLVALTAVGLLWGDLAG